MCTSLLDKEKYTEEQIGAVYGLRWEVEEEYKLLKARIEVEAFSGRTAISIYQDFYAKIFMMAICSTLAYPIAEKVKEEYSLEKKQSNKFEQKINRTNALSVIRDHIYDILLNFKNKTMEYIYRIIEKSRVIIKPDRNFKRTSKIKRQYHTSYKGI